MRSAARVSSASSSSPEAAICSRRAHLLHFWRLDAKCASFGHRCMADERASNKGDEKVISLHPADDGTRAALSSHKGGWGPMLMSAFLLAQKRGELSLFTRSVGGRSHANKVLARVALGALLASSLLAVKKGRFAPFPAYP